METSFISAAGILGLASYLLWWKRSEKTYSLLVLLFATLGIVYLSKGFENTSFASTLSALLVSSLSLSYLASRLLKFSAAVIVGVVLSFLPFILLGKEEVFLDYPLVFGTKDALILPLLGAFFALILAFKARILTRFFDIQAEKSFPIAQVFGFGILYLAADTFGSQYGLILVGTGYLNVQFFQEKQEQTTLGFSFSFFALAMLVFASKVVGVEFSQVLSGPGILGLFLGLGSVAWITGFDEAKETTVLKRLAAFCIPVLFFTLFLALEKVKEFTGGPTALLYVLFALSISIYWIAQKQLLLLINIFLTGFVLLQVSAPFFQPIESNMPVNSKLLNSTDSKQTKKAEKEDILDRKGESLSAAIGSWKINSKQSKLTFELGQEGKKTKGFFADVTGKVAFLEPLSNSSFSVKIPVKSLSTFNDYRDESLMSAAYFNEAKFPTLTFESKRLIEEGDRFKIEGNFTMMGVTKAMSIEMKVALTGVEDGKKFVVLLGKSSLNRTQFGQTSDPKIGDVVDFEFEVELTE